jgi:hypothetical protein
VVLEHRDQVVITSYEWKWNCSPLSEFAFGINYYLYLMLLYRVCVANCWIQLHCVISTRATEDFQSNC